LDVPLAELQAQLQEWLGEPCRGWLQPQQLAPKLLKKSWLQQVLLMKSRL
jgi:hypothetical protein